MTKIFISYRRADTQFVTDIVHDKMIAHFGDENVFLDVGSIPFGVDFRQYLNEQVAAHDVVLVIIGTDWARIMKERTGQTNDFVRIEIESALAQNKLVIPVLVKNASMPSFADLPESIRDLQWRNSATIRRKPDLDADCLRLAQGIQQWAASIGEASPSKPQTSTKKNAKPVPTKPSSKSLMPAPFDWIEIPKKGYSIAKYPVTNAQYAKFIDAGGYNTERWWTKDGWQQKQDDSWTEPRFWTDGKFNGDTQPVVGVSWYESVAFCLWLSDITGEKIMLPTEKQWQYAAQGDDGRTYPWGNNWYGARCQNRVDDNNPDRTSPVTTYQGKGDSPFGVVDMAGNVWEWCLTDADTRSNDTDGTNERVLRGGSWFNVDTVNFRFAYRNGNSPFYRYDGGGFRIARSYTASES